MIASKQRIRGLVSPNNTISRSNELDSRTSRAPFGACAHISASRSIKRFLNPAGNRLTPGSLTRNVELARCASSVVVAAAGLLRRSLSIRLRSAVCGNGRRFFVTGIGGLHEILTARCEGERNMARTSIFGVVRRRAALTMVLTCYIMFPRTSYGEFALKDGDTVVFLGDSITAARTYGKIIENYTLLRFPDRKVHFINAGWGGDTAAGGLKRLDRDVFRKRTTVLIVAYGINDIGWGVRADAEHKKIYLDSIRDIVEQCKAHGVRAYIGSAAVTAENPDTAEHGFLQTMCDEGMALARSEGGCSIDIQRTMRSIQRRVLQANASAKPKDQSTLHAPDGIHLNDLGQLAMAFAILKGLEAPAEVSAVSIDAGRPKLTATTGCRVTNLTGRLDGESGPLEFDRIDDGLPVNFGLFGALQFRFVPIPDQLNRYMLTITNLKPGRYDVHVDGRALGQWSEKEMAAGLNIASATADGWQPGGPWDAAATILIAMTNARDEIANADRFLDHYLPTHPRLPELHVQSPEIDIHIEELQRTLLKPRPFHFVVSRAPADKR